MAKVVGMDFRAESLIAVKTKQFDAAKPVISAEERQRRQEAVDYARASVGLEGFKISRADEERGRRYIEGTIDLAEFVKG